MLYLPYVWDFYFVRTAMIGLSFFKKSNLIYSLSVVLAGCFLLCLSTTASFAGEAVTTTAKMDGAKVGGEVVECELNENNKKQIAQNAYKALSTMKEDYKNFNGKYLSLYKNYKNDKNNKNSKETPCHYLYGSLSKSIDEIFTSEPSFGANDKEGAEIADKYFKPATGNNTISKMFDELNDTEYTDVNVTKLKNRALQAQSKMKEALDNLKTKKEAIIEEESYNLLKSVYDRSIDCFALKIDKDGQVTCSRGMSINKKLGTLQQFTQKVEKSDQYAKCSASLDELSKIRNKYAEDRRNAHTFLAALSEGAKKQCFCDKDSGSLDSCKVVDDTYEEDNVNSEECKALNEYAAELNICPTCGIFQKILQSAQKLSGGAFDKLAKPLQGLLVIGLALFIGYQVLLLIGSPAAQTTGKFLNTLLIQSFKVAIAYFLLSDPTTIYENAIEPIISGGFEFGLGLAPAGDIDISGYAEKYSFTDKESLLSSHFLKNIMGAVEGYNNLGAQIPALGRALMCYAWIEKQAVIFPQFSILLEGIIIYVFGLMILLAVGFYLLDCAIHLCIICCLLPLLIASWPFKMTAKYTKTGWGMLLNVFFRFVMLGVVIVTAFELMKNALEQQGDLEGAINSNDINAIKDAMQISGMQMVLLVACSMMAMKIIKESGMLASKFEGGGAATGDLGAKLGGTAASAATAIAKPVAKGAAKKTAAAAGAVAEASGVKGGAQALGGAVKSKASQVLGAMGMGSKAKMAGGRDSGKGGNADKDGDKKDDNKKDDNKKDDNKDDNKKDDNNKDS